MVFEREPAITDLAGDVLLSRLQHVNPKDQRFPSLDLPEIDDRALVEVRDDLPVVVEQVLVVVPGEASEEPVGVRGFWLAHRDTDDPALGVEQETGRMKLGGTLTLLDGSAGHLRPHLTRRTGGGDSRHCNDKYQDNCKPEACAVLWAALPIRPRHDKC